MHFSTLLPLSLLLPFTFTLAQPQRYRPSPLSASAETNNFLINGFQAWVGDADSSHPNWVSFDAQGSTNSSHYKCLVVSSKPIYSQLVPCRKIDGSAEDKVWFKVSGEFNEVEIKRLREVDGTWLNELFTQGTYWGAANATTTIYNGRYYKRQQPWTFEVTNTHG